jgi:hypothetical protein
MPRDGSLILSDVRGPTLTIVCEPCNRRGRYRVERLMAEPTRSRPRSINYRGLPHQSPYPQYRLNLAPAPPSRAARARPEVSQ